MIALVAMDQVRWHPDGEKLGAKIVSRTKGDTVPWLINRSIKVHFIIDQFGDVTTDT